MLVLGIDTATPIASVGLIRDGSVLAEQSRATAASHAENLLPLIQHVLDHSQVSLSEVEGIGVTIGPGAFSGLRIALGTVKGFAYALSQRVAGVSTLLTLAHAVPDWTGRLCVVLDARKRAVYTAFFARDAGGQIIRLTEDVVLSPEELTNRVFAPCLFVGDGVERYGAVIRENCGPHTAFIPLTAVPSRGSTVARLAWARFKQGDHDDVAQLIPHYIRRSDAERNRLKQRSEESGPRGRTPPW